MTDLPGPRNVIVFDDVCVLCSGFARLPNNDCWPRSIHVRENDDEHHDDELVAGGLLKTWNRPDWYVFATERQDWISGTRELRRLYRRAWNPCTKVTRWIKAKYYSANSDCWETGAIPPALRESDKSPLIRKSMNAAQGISKILP